MKIRFFEKTDHKWVRNCALADKTMRLRLDIRGGFKDDFFKNDNWNATFVMEYMKEKLGFSAISFYSNGLKSCLNELYIVKNKRRNGLGRELAQYSIDYARENWGGNFIYAFTIENKPMEKLLKNLNFKNIGIYKKWVYRNRRYYDQSCFKLNW